MRKLAILTFQTLDGVMQSPTSLDEDPSGNFSGGGWATNYWDDVMEQVVQEAMSEPYDLLLGRKTYELFAPNFSNSASDNPVAEILNAATKYVVTSTLSKFEWSNTKAITGNVVKEIAQLKNQKGNLLQVHGSWQLIQTLLANDLVDEFRLWTFPEIVGSGKQLFKRGVTPKSLTLVKSGCSQTGATMSIYRRDHHT